MMKHPSFVPAASRRLVLVYPDGRKASIFLGVGVPYTPAAEPKAGAAGCLVLTCDDPDLTIEIAGEDELEAMAAAINFLDLYLLGLIEETGGVLEREDGSSFDPRGSAVFQASRNILDEKRRRR